MKLKLDENLGRRGQTILQEAQFDVVTVLDQQMGSATDTELSELCASEGRVLVTLDLDFANPLRFPTEGTPGIAVLRLPGRASDDLLLQVVRTLAGALLSNQIQGKLWVVEPGRIRIHEFE